MTESNYKQSEIGPIPCDWSAVVMKDVASVARGGSPRPIEAFLTDLPDGINWIKIGDVGIDAKYIEHTEERIVPTGAQYSRRVFPGDFLLSNSMSFGRPYILNIDGCIHDGWLVIQDYHDTFDTDYLYYALSSAYMQSQYRALAAGSSVLNLNKEIVKGVYVFAPSLQEQKRIAKALSDVDYLLDVLQKKLDKSKNIREGVLEKLLSCQVRLNGFESDWQDFFISDICDEITDGPFGSDLKTEHYTEEKEARIIQLGNVGEDGWDDNNVKYTTFEHAQELKRCIVAGGTVVIAKMMPAGRSIVCPNDERMYIQGSDVVKLVLKEGFNPKFFVYMTKTKAYIDQIEQNTQGSTRARVSVTKLKTISIPIPSIEEQNAIVACLEDMDNEIASIGQSIKKYVEIKNGMMQQLLTGKIRLV